MKKILLIFVGLLIFCSLAFAQERYVNPSDNTNPIIERYINEPEKLPFDSNVFDQEILLGLWPSINSETFDKYKNFNIIAGDGVVFTVLKNGFIIDVNVFDFNISDLNIIGGLDLNSLFIRTDGSSITTASIPFAQGLTVAGTITSGDITILDATPIFVFKDSDSLGASSVGFIEWRDSGGGRAGFLGNNTSGDDGFLWKNEQGGNIGIQTTGTGKLKVFANIDADGDLNVNGDANFAEGLSLPDDKKITFGDSDDVSLEFGGSNWDFNSEIVGYAIRFQDFSSLTLTRDAELNFRLKAFGSSAFPIISTTRALGTQASPLPVTSGKELMIFQANGQTSASSSKTGGQIIFSANENWSITNSGTKILFRGAVDGQSTITDWMQFDNANVLIPNGNLVIDKTSIEALLVRKNADGGDVFIVDTTNTRVGIGEVGNGADLILYGTGGSSVQWDEALDKLSIIGVTGSGLHDALSVTKIEDGTGAIGSIKRVAVFQTNFADTSNNGDTHFTFNAFATSSAGFDGNLTNAGGLGGGLVAGRYGIRHFGGGYLDFSSAISLESTRGFNALDMNVNNLFSEGFDGGGGTNTMKNANHILIGSQNTGNIENLTGIRIEEQTTGTGLNLELMLEGAGAVFFRNQDLNIFSSADGTLNIFADDSVDINSNLHTDKNIIAREDLTFVGTGSGLSFGGIDFDGGLGGASTFDVITTNVGEANKVQIEGFDSDSNSNNVSFNSDSNSLTILVTGNYWVAINFSSSSTQSNDYEAVVYRNNGATDTPVHAHRTTSTAGRIANFGGGGIVFFNAGDTVEVWLVRNDGGAVSRTMTFEHADLSIFQLGG